MLWMFHHSPEYRQQLYNEFGIPYHCHYHRSENVKSFHLRCWTMVPDAMCYKTFPIADHLSIGHCKSTNQIDIHIIRVQCQFQLVVFCVAWKTRNVMRSSTKLTAKKSYWHVSCISSCMVKKCNWICLFGGAVNFQMQSLLGGYRPGLPGDAIVPRLSVAISPPQTGFFVVFESEKKWVLCCDKTKCVWNEKGKLCGAYLDQWMTTLMQSHHERLNCLNGTIDIINSL